MFTERSATAPPVPVASGAEPVALSVRGLRVSFGGRAVLDGVDLDVPAGALVAVLGANGSGKSTALRCISGLLTADAGSVRVCGEDVSAGGDPGRRRRHRQRHRHTAMVFQAGHLVRRRSAFDNVCSGALGRLPLHRSWSTWTFPRAVREEAMACLDQVGLADRADDRVSRLSGGQQQRVAVARALCQRAEVLLADEPVSALDPAAAEQVLALLADLAHHRRLAVVAVLHQPALALRHADRIVGLRSGRVCLDAPSTAVAPDAVADLYPGAGSDGTHTADVAS